MPNLTLDQYINKPSSEKLLVSWIEPSRRQFNWTVHSGSIYKKTMTYYVVNVHQNGTQLTEVASLAAVTSAGKWFFDDATKILYVWSRSGVVSADPGYQDTANDGLTFSSSDVNISSDVITLESAPATATPVLLEQEENGTVPGGLADATAYWVIRVSPTTIKLATSEANANAGTAINLTSVGSGTHTFRTFVFTSVTFRLFFSNYPVDLPWNLTDGGRLVPYEGLISSTSQFGASMDSERHGTALESVGTITFYNNDLFFDDIFDKLVWEGKTVSVFALHRRLALANKVRLFEGQVTGKQFSAEEVTFEVTDFIFQLKEKLSIPQYSPKDFAAGDSNTELLPEGSNVGKYKRRVYGRVDGLLLDSAQKVDEIGQALSGTFSVVQNVDDAYSLLTGTSSDIHDELSPGDVIVAYDEFDNELPTPLTIETLSRIDILANTQMTVDFLWAPTVANTLEFVGASSTFDLANLSIGDHIVIKGFNVSSVNKGIWEVTAFPAATVIRVARTGYTGGANQTNVTINVDTAFDIVCVKASASDQTLKVAGEFPAQFSGQSFFYLPTTPITSRNRKFFVTHHVNQQLSTTISEIEPSLRYILVSDTDQFRTGDIIVIGTTELIINNIEPDTDRFILDLQPTLSNQAPDDQDVIDFLASISVGATVTRPCVQNLYHVANPEEKQTYSRFNASDYTISNDPSTGCSVTLQTDAEFNVGKDNTIRGTHWLQNSRVVFSPEGFFGERFAEARSRDWIKNDADGTWLEIEEIVDGTLAILRTTYTGASSTSATSTLRRVRYITDGSQVACDVYGITKDNTATGDLVATASDVVKHILQETDASSRVDDTSFDEASEDGPFLVSYAVPSTKDDSAPVRRDAINIMNDAIFGAVYNDINYDIAYKVLLPGRIRDNLRYLSDEDILGFEVNVDSSKIVKTVNVRYKFQDIDYRTGRSSFVTASGETVPIRAYVTYTNLQVDFNESTDRKVDLDLQLYTSGEANIMAQRYAFIHRTSQSLVTVFTKLQTIDLQLNDLVEIEFDRLYSRFGNQGTDRVKIGLIVDIKKEATGVVLVIDDLGNIFNANSVIAADGADDYATSDSIELRYNAHITDQKGLVDGDDDLYGNNLIA